MAEKLTKVGQEKPQHDERITEVITELKKLNAVSLAASKKNVLGDKEAATKTEKMSAAQKDQGKAADEGGWLGSRVGMKEQFARRFAAGQALRFSLPGVRAQKEFQLEQIEQLKLLYEDSQWQKAQAIIIEGDLVKEKADKEAAEKAKAAAAEEARREAGKGDKDEDKKKAAKKKKQDDDDDKKIEKAKGGFFTSLLAGLRGAAGMASVGLGIGGFVSGLMVWSTVEAFTGANFSTQMKNLVSGWNELGNLNKTALVSLGAMVGAGALFGAVLGPTGAIKGAIGMTAVGLGLGGFMTGIMAAGEWSGFTGQIFADQMGNLVKGFNTLGGMNQTAVVALTSLATLGAITGAVSIGTAGMAAGGMVLAGMGLGGFMTGMMAAGEWSGFTGATFATQMTNLTAGFNALSTLDGGSKAALTTLATLGAITGTVSIGTTAFAAGGMALAGMGLGGFMAGMAAAGDITGFKGDHFKAQAQNIADGLSAFSGAQLTGLTALMGVGAVLGPSGSAIAATGMGIIGIGIGAFVGGIAGIGDVLGAMGVNGSGLKTMLQNIGGGLAAFNDIDGTNFKTLGTGVAALGVGLAALFGVNGLTKVTNFFSSAWNDVKALFGAESDQRTGLEKLLADIVVPFESIDYAKWNTIDASGFGNNLTHISKGLKAWAEATPGFWESMGKWAAGLFGDDDPFDEFIAIGEKHTELGQAATAIDKLADALIKLNALDFDADKFQFQKFASDLAWATKGIHVAMYGGTYNPPGWGGDNRKVSIRKGKGLVDIPALDFENASTGINLLQHSLTKWDGNTTKGDTAAASAAAPATIITDQSATVIINHTPEIVTFTGKQGIAPIGR